MPENSSKEGRVHTHSAHTTLIWKQNFMKIEHWAVKLEILEFDLNPNVQSLSNDKKNNLVT